MGDTQTQREQYVAACKLKAEIEAQLLFNAQNSRTPPATREPSHPDDSWLTLTEAAKYMKYSLRTVQQWARTNQIATHGKGRNRRIKRSACDRKLKQQKE